MHTKFPVQDFFGRSYDLGDYHFARAVEAFDFWWRTRQVMYATGIEKAVTLWNGDEIVYPPAIDDFSTYWPYIPTL